MPEDFFSLKRKDQKDALGAAATASGRPDFLLEKDVWIVRALAALFGSEFGAQLVFKGGTSLSKAYNAIQRFSEDVDITYDIRALAPDLVGDAANAIPRNRSQAEKWSDEIREKRLPAWVANEAFAIIAANLAKTPGAAKARVEKDRIFIEYEPLGSGGEYVPPRVQLEFGGRSTGEPCETKEILCDASKHVAGVVFPSSSARVMRIERTFWEKATAVHVFCRQEKLGGDKLVRHWSDLGRLDEGGYAAKALADRGLGRDVAVHKQCFFRAKDALGHVIDYMEAVQGSLTLVPAEPMLDLLRKDYRSMIDSGLLLDPNPESFEKLMERCGALATRANASVSASDVSI